ncbi:MAG: 6-phosphofructokinase [Lachnospiraceae bacterium]|nr:6-phosphofructokinase [Lachnospiraceae bacterium]
MSKKNILVGQSGGPTSVINASLYGVVSAGMAHADRVDKVIGMVNGIEGFLQGKTTVLSDVPADELKLLQTTPAAYLGSCRYKLPEDLDDPVFPELFAKFEEMNIGYFFYCGGNDSMDTVSKLSRYGAKIGSEIRCMGVPKTIDNDLIITDHCPGYGSAAKYVATTIRQVALDAVVYDKKFVTIIEVMGRHAGWLTASAVLARKFEGDNPKLIYMPETDFTMEQFFADLDRCMAQEKSVVVAVSEGIHDKDGTFICEYARQDVAVDNFGHKQLTGTAAYLADAVSAHYPGIKVRGIELSLTQRCGVTNGSATDMEEATQVGSLAVEEAMKGETGKMIAFIREPGSEYKITYQPVDVNEVCNEEKPFPAEWINAEGNDILQGYIDYALPLIQGNTPVVYEDGLPKFIYRK